MTPWRTFILSVHITALGIWLGVLITTGFTAAILFPTIKDLDPTLPAYAAYIGDHWLIAAGKPAAQLFFFADAISFIACLTAIATFLAQIVFFKLPRTAPSTLLRSFALSIALAALVGYLFFVAMPMNLALSAYWDAAAAGSNDLAATHQDAFQQLHPLASRLLSLMALCSFVALILAPCTPTASPSLFTPHSTSPNSPLQTPKLANRR